MPTHKVKGGYKWGKHGKVYPTKKQADKQAQAIYASGWKESKINERKNKNIMKKQLIRLTENDLHKIIEESVQNIILEWKKKREPRTGTIEINGEHIRATEDGLDRNGNPMYKVKHPSIKGRKTKDGYNRVQHYNFKPDRTNESLQRITESDLHKIIKESVKRIISEKEESKKKLEKTMMYTYHGNNNIHDYKGKASMNALGMNGKEGMDIAKNDKGVGEYDRYDIDECIKHSIKEAFSDYYNVSHFEDPNKEYYQSFVIVDGTRAVVGNYDNYEEAVEDAKEMAHRYKGGTFEVYGCDEDGYALEEDYPEDNTLVYSTDEDFA